MASIWNVFNRKEDKEEEKNIRNAERIQDFINKFKVSSRDLDNSMFDKKDEEALDQGWQGYSWIQQAIATSKNRAVRYKEYREMTKVPELEQSLNIYSDNSTQYNVDNNVLNISSDNNKIVEILNKLFFDILDINANLWHYVRNMCKFGDEFLEVSVDNIDKPKSVMSLERIKSPENMYRVERDGNLLRFEYRTGEDDVWNVSQSLENSTIFQPWQIIHLQIEDEEFAPYGKSVFESGRSTWKKLSLMEDAMLIYRISRAPERRVFYMDVGTLSTREANKFIEQVKRQFRKKKFINPATGEIDDKANPLCLTLDTEIPLLDGRTLTLSELIKEHSEGKENWVYSIDVNNENQIVPGKIVWAGETRKNASLVKVTLDNGETLRVTPDHRFMSRDGSYIEAQNLTEGQSLMPLYKKENQTYEQVYNPRTGKYKYTHHLVAEKEIKPPKQRAECIHHYDYNPRNNDPKNLEVLTIEDHRKRHDYIYKLSAEKIGFNSSEEWLLTECDVPTKNHRFEYKNHKVTKVEWLDHLEDTGDITIDKYHNFATASGVFVHNSVDEDFFIPVRQNSQGTRIETLPGGQNLGEIDDVRYFKEQILRTLGIPIGYLGGASEGGVGYDPKSYLSNQEIQFARTIERIQKFLIKGLEKIAIVQLALNKIPEKEIREFKIRLTPPSNVDQLIEVEIRSQQFGLIQNIRSIVSNEGIPFLPDEWIYKNVLQFSDQEINRIRLQVQMQMQMNNQIQQMFAAAPGEGGGFEGGGVDVVGGELGGPAPAMAGGPPEGGEELPPGGGEVGPPAPGGEEPGLEIASRKPSIEFDGGRWLVENSNDFKKLIEYIKLYEKVHKDNTNKVYEHSNSMTRMAIRGEFRGLLKAYKSSNTRFKTLNEVTAHKQVRKIRRKK